MKFTIAYPVRPLHVFQGFGKANTDPSVLHIYQGLGLQGHNGLDCFATHGQPVHASHDGMAYYETDSNQGHGIVLRTNEPYEYEGKVVYFKTIYWHFCDPVKEPQHKSPIPDDGQGHPVKRGDILGYADSTGLSTGDHLHWGLKPQLQNEANGAWVNTDQNNGYLGAIDPTPYMDGTYADTTLVTEPVPIPTQDLSPADNVAVLAAKSEAAGDTKTASILWAVVQFIKSFLMK